MRILFATSFLFLVVGCDKGPDIPEWTPPPAEYVDVRFRGVGHALSPDWSTGATGGTIAGVPGPIAWWEGIGLTAWGITLPDFMSTAGLVTSSDSTQRTLTQSWEGADCPSLIQSAMTANAAILGIGGDPDSTGTACTFFGVAPDAATSPRFEYMSGKAQEPPSIEATLSADSAARSFVVTALVEVADGKYSFIAESVGPVAGVYEQFQTAIRAIDLTTLAAQVEALSAAGYGITASAWTGGKYTIVGTRPATGAKPRSSRVIISNIADHRTEIQALLADGFAPVSVTLATTPGSDTPSIYVIGQR